MSSRLNCSYKSRLRDPLFIYRILVYIYVCACVLPLHFKKGRKYIAQRQEDGGAHIIRPNRRREPSLLGANRGNKKEQMGRENNKGKRKEKDKDEDDGDDDLPIGLRSAAGNTHACRVRTGCAHVSCATHWGVRGSDVPSPGARCTGVSRRRHAACHEAEMHPP